MYKIILLIFCLTFTNINGNVKSTECGYNPNCQCSSNVLNDIKVVHNSNKGVTLGLQVKSWSDLQINCKHIDWNNIDFTSDQSEKLIQSLEFINCRLPNTTSLKKIVRKLGIENTDELSFQSHTNLTDKLKKEDFEGFSNVDKLILSHNALTNISNDLFSDFVILQELDLSENEIVLPRNIFRNTINLKRLNLWGNSIEHLPFGVFDNLDKLKYLNLMSNKLSELNDKIFFKLKSLITLNLSVNKLDQLTNLTFSKLKKLEVLDLSFNKFKTFPKDLLKQNTKLKQLMLHDNEVNLARLPEKFLSGFQDLQEVYLTKNGFTTLPVDLFWDSTTLMTIHLNDNYLRTLPAQIFKGLNNVGVLLLDGNMIEELPDGIFNDMWSLTKLSLSKNRLTTISRNLFHGLLSLNILNVDNNLLTSIEHEALYSLFVLTVAKFSNNQLQLENSNGKQSPFANNTRLHELDLSHNKITHFFSDWALALKYLRILDLSYNDIDEMTGNTLLFESPSIKVDLSHNKIKSIPFDSIERLANDRITERDVVLELYNNPLLCDCNLYNLLLYLNNELHITIYNFVELRVGNTKCVKSDGTVGPQINHIDLKTYKCLEDEYLKIVKHCQPMCTCLIRPYDRFRILDCSYRNMTTFEIDHDKLIFRGKYPLILNLTGNYLTELPNVDAFIPLNITGLLLSNNRICNMSIERLPANLTILELHNNNISKVNVSVMNYFLTTPFHVFTLSGNPIKCDCNAEDILVFVQVKRFKYTDLENLRCKDLDIPLIDATKKQLCESETELYNDEEVKEDETDAEVKEDKTDSEVKADKTDSEVKADKTDSEVEEDETDSEVKT